MIWTDDGPDATALAETFEGALDDDVVVACAAVSPDGIGQAITKGDVGPFDRFEIGSITKPITATLAVVLVGEGKLDLSDEIGRWLEAGPNGAITVEQLATHTSGLPRLAPNALSEPIDMSNPYARFTPELAEEGLRTAKLTPERTVSYSNFGFQLLGLVLERASGESFDQLLSTRLTGPLGLDHTGVRSAEMLGNRVTGRAGGRAVPHWDQMLHGPGGIESSLADMAKLAQTFASPPDSPLGRAIRSAQEPRVEAANDRRQGLGWVIEPTGIVWHNGGTGGFRSQLALDPSKGRAIVLLANSADVGDDLHKAADLAIQGEDPKAARPAPLSAEWAQRFTSLGDDFVARKFDDIHAQLSPEFAEKVSARQLGLMWKLSTFRAGKAGPVEAECKKSSGAVVGEITVSCRRRPIRLAAAFTPDGKIAGLKVLKPDEASPF